VVAVGRSRTELTLLSSGFLMLALAGF